MTQVGVASGADYFGTNHAVADITHFDHRTAFQRGVEARPAAARVELGGGVEQRLFATDAMVDARCFRIVVLPGKRPLGALEATNVVLRRVEHFFPLFERFLQLVHRYTSEFEKARSVPFPQIRWHV